MPFGDLFALLNKESRLESSADEGRPRVKPFNTIAVAIFAIAAVVHLLRLGLGWEVTVDHVIIPMWVSVLGLVVAAALAGMLWGENRRAQ